MRIEDTMDDRNTEAREPIYEASLMREIDLAVLEQPDMRQRILNRVKNDAQRYLMDIKKGIIPS
jgi:hypothetical protein